MLQEPVNSYSGHIKTIVDRIYYEKTGQCIDELLNQTVIADEGPIPKLQILVRDRQDLNPLQFTPEYNTDTDTIVGGVAEINRVGLSSDIVLNGLAKELYGGYHQVVDDFTAHGGTASELTTNDWQEGISMAYASEFIRTLEEQGKYDRRMKDTPADRSLLASVPGTWSQSRPSDQGLMALWYEIMSNPSWKTEVQTASDKALSTATLAAVKDYFWGLDRQAYQGSNNFSTGTVKQDTSDVLAQRVSTSSTRTNFTVSLNTP